MSNSFKFIGSVSSGTMRAEDLIPAFVGVIDDLKEELSLSVTTTTTAEQTEDIKRQVSAIDDRLGRIEQAMNSDDYFDSEEAQYDLEWCFETLESFAPAYFYFGAHPGDGSDYGFWLSEDIAEVVRDNDGLVVDDTSEVPDDYSGEVLHINDHGNATLYSADNGELTEVWSVV